jgi:hypothetical protein
MWQSMVTNGVERFVAAWVKMLFRGAMESSAEDVNDMNSLGWVWRRSRNWNSEGYS